MQIISLLFLSLLSLLLSGCQLAQVADDSDQALEASLFSPAYPRSFQLSPDGNWVAWLQGPSKSAHIFVRNIQSGQTVNLLPKGDQVELFAWVDNQKLVYQGDRGGRGYSRVYLLDRMRGNPIPFVAYPGIEVKLIDALRRHEGVFVVSTKATEKDKKEIIRIDWRKSVEQRITVDPNNTIQRYFFSDEGQLLGLMVKGGASGDLLLFRDSERQAFKPLVTISPFSHLFPIALDYDEKSFWVLSSEGRETYGVFKLDIATGQLSEAILEHADFDIDSVFLSDSTQTLVGGTYHSAGRNYLFTNQASEEEFHKIISLVDSASFVGLSESLDEQKVIVKLNQGMGPGDIYLVDLKANQSSLLVGHDQWQGVKAREPVLIPALSSDASGLEGFITYSDSVEPQEARLLMMLHAGPLGARVEAEFDPLARYFSKKGFNVLQINYRGTSGRGRGFERTSSDPWGYERSLADIEAALLWLEQHPVLAGQSVFLLGNSLGGSLAMISSMEFRDRVECSAAINPVLDFVALESRYRMLRPNNPDRYRNLFGDPVLDQLKMRALSPANRLSILMPPTLILREESSYEASKAEFSDLEDEVEQRALPIKLTEWTKSADEGGEPWLRDVSNFYKTCLSEE